MPGAIRSARFGAPSNAVDNGERFIRLWKILALVGGDGRKQMRNIRGRVKVGEPNPSPAIIGSGGSGPNAERRVDGGAWRDAL